MTTILDADLRADLGAAHAATLADLATPGEWLSSTERVALARVVRAARAEADRPPWYRPSTERDDFPELPPHAVDAAWRLTNHPGTLTADWYDSIVGGLPSPEYYVELVGIVAAINSVDRLAGVLDVDVLPLPEPGTAEPPREPSDGVVTSHWVPIAREMRGPNVLKALSIAPSVQAMRARLSEAQYLPGEALLGDLDWTRGKIDRRQVELIAAITSRNNECFY